MEGESMSNLDYSVLKNLYRLNKPMKIGAISKKLGVRHSTLGSCIRRLKQVGLVSYEAYREVELTENGKNLAKELIRHCQLLEVLLHNELGLSPREAHHESERFNLLLSCNTTNKICKKYGHPKRSPCGEIIQTSEGCRCESNTH